MILADPPDAEDLIWFVVERKESNGWSHEQEVKGRRRHRAALTV